MNAISIMTMNTSQEVQNFVKTALMGLPIKVLPSCATVKDAYALYGKEQPQIAIVDLFIPGSSGVDIVKSLRKMNDSIVIILLNRTNTKALVERAFRMGANDVLPYPLEKETLKDTVLHRLKNFKEAEVHFN